MDTADAQRSALAWVQLPAALVLAGSCGCAAEFEPYPLPEAPLCGGAVCFQPTDVRVQRQGDDVMVTAWRAEDAGCALPHGGSPPLGGTVIEIKLVKSPQAALDAPLPIAPAWESSDLAAPHVVARAFRIDGRDGRAVSDEQAVDGEATLSDLDVAARRVKLTLRGRWSSGVEGDLVLTSEGTAHACGD
jgi:hypothetical protein